MKKPILLLILFCFLVTIHKSNACSPVETPFIEWLNDYNKNDYIIVEGYFQPASESHYTSSFKVTRSSDSSIKIAEEYEVSKYGPYGSMCRMNEMKASVEPELIGKENPRLLIVYKDRSINGKLVTPIFWEAGVDASNDKIISKKYNYKTEKHVLYESSTSLPEIWKQISKGNITVVMNEMTKKRKK